MPKKKKNNRRSKIKYPALNPQYNLKTRTDLLDYDYIDQLSEKEKQWLNNFSEEYVNANFKHSGKRIHKRIEKETIIKKTGKKKRVDTFKQESETRNNARNRCVLTKEKAGGLINYLEDLKDLMYENDSESNMIDRIELMPLIREFIEYLETKELDFESMTSDQLKEEFNHFKNSGSNTDS